MGELCLSVSVSVSVSVALEVGWVSGPCMGFWQAVVRNVDRALNCLDMSLFVSRGRSRDDQFEKDQPRFAVICADATKNATMNRALEWCGVSSPVAARLFSSIPD